MKVLENKTGRKIEEVITISKRDSNKKRPYLILNKLQAKYLPVHAHEALDMFNELGKQIELEEKNKTVLVVGFAETATAIGAQIASLLQEKYPKNEIVFLPTTREDYGKDISRIDFKEEHSHAVEQILYTDCKKMTTIDYLIFAEDEVTTGNTICNCVKQLRMMCPKLKAKILVASLLNCMDETENKRFEELGIKAYYNLKTDKSGFELYKTETDHSDVLTANEINKGFVQTFVFDGKGIIKNPRMGVKISVYEQQIKDLAKEISKIGFKENEKILCLGTEECMYPAILVAKQLEKFNKVNAYTQATTRVPICVHDNDEDSLNTRYAVESLYGERNTYIYNIDTYDHVFLISDGNRLPLELIKVLEAYKNKKISIVYI